VHNNRVILRNKTGSNQCMGVEKCVHSQGRYTWKNAANRLKTLHTSAPAVYSFPRSYLRKLRVNKKNKSIHLGVLEKSDCTGRHKKQENRRVNYLPYLTNEERNDTKDSSGYFISTRRALFTLTFANASRLKILTTKPDSSTEA